MPTSRAPEGLVKQAYDHLLNVGTSLSKLRDAALTDRLLPPSTDPLRIPGRSIAWKLFLTPEGPLSPSTSLPLSSLVTSLRHSRKQYTEQLKELSRAPDGVYHDGAAMSALTSEKSKVSESQENLETNNPLSLHDKNPWNDWFAAIELRKTILQDVERTFPDIEFFRDPQVQVQLTNILFLHSTLHSSVGYRQGMHEILAPLYHAVDYDAITETGKAGDSKLSEICSAEWVAADSYALFDLVMSGLSPWYEWQEPKLPSKGPMQQWVAPIVETCNKIQSNFLRGTDPVLWKHLQATGIEPTIFGIRWLRLLFTREFDMASSMKLWDGLFACDPTLQLAQWVCVAMLIRIRNELISADYSTQLTALLRYPPSPSQPAFEGAPHHASLLIRQALALQLAPNQATGASCTLENNTLLNIPADVPAPSPRPQHRKTPSGRGRMGQHGVSASEYTPSSIAEMIARGVMERGESLGINKTVMNAVTELKRNMPELGSLVRQPLLSPSSYPLSEEDAFGYGDERQLRLQKELGELRLLNKRLGEQLTQSLQLLEGDGAQESQEKALRTIGQVRDALIGQSVGRPKTPSNSNSSQSPPRPQPVMGRGQSRPSVLSGSPPSNTPVGSATWRRNEVPAGTFTRSAFAGRSPGAPLVSSQTPQNKAVDTPKDSGPKSIKEEVKASDRLQDPLGVLK